MSEDKRQLPQGNYVGKIEDYGVSNSKAGKAQAFIKFKIDKGPGEGYAELTWFGGLSNEVAQGKKRSPMSRTVETLLDCGFKGNDTDDLATGPGNEVLKLGTEMSLTIQDDEYEGVLRSKIAWVNVVGAGGVKRATKEELAGKIDTSAFRAMLLKGKETRPTGDYEPPF